MTEGCRSGSFSACVANRHADPISGNDNLALDDIALNDVITLEVRVLEASS